MNLDQISEDVRLRFDQRMDARERALPASRRAIRSCANSIRAIHRFEWELAHQLMDQAKAAIDEGLSAVRDHPEIRFAGYLQDAQKEYAEARITEAVVTGVNQLPTPEELAVDDIYYVLVSMDYPDAITMNLRRSTDVARSLIEKTRGDLSIAIVQRQLRDALDRHAKDVLGQ